MSFESMKPLQLVTVATVARRVAFVALAGAAMFAASANAADNAADEVTMEKRIVTYSDLNLQNQSDAAELYARLRRAANSVCSTFEAPTIRVVTERNECVDEALSNAVAKVDNYAVTALHAKVSRVRVAESGAGDQPRG
jgi:UrcA family protein